MRTCVECKYYAKHYDTSGECHRRPPVLVVHEDSVKSAWPDVHEQDWCGEWVHPNWDGN